MAKKKKFSVDKLRGVVNMGKESEESMDEALHILVLVDKDCPSWIALAVKDALVPERDARVEVSSLDKPHSVLGVDITLVLAGGSEDLVRSAIRTYAGQRRMVIVVAETSLDIPDSQLPSKLSQFIVSVIGSDREQLLDKLSATLLDSTEKDVSCAANFGFCRQAATARLVSRCAAHNALMGVADFIPGAGMPLMTMNQINLGFDMAATYGKGMSIGRLPEVLFIIAAGLTYRSVAKLLLRGAPALSIVIRAGIAYAGSVLTGRALADHFVASLPATEEETGVVVV